MPSIKWHHVTLGSAIRIIALAGASTVKETFLRIIWPFKRRVLSFRNALARLWLGTAFAVNPLIFYSSAQEKSVQKFTHRGTDFFLVPSLDQPREALEAADAVVLFAHGGGMIIGHPLQYLDEYRRWVQKGIEKGKRVIFVAVKYRKSTQYAFRGVFY